MARLTIKRGSKYPDRFRSYRVLLDGEDLGKLRVGGVLHAEVSDGPHVIEAQIDWCSSEPFEFDAVGDQVIIVRNAQRGWRQILLPWTVVSAPGSYLVVEPGDE